MATDGVLKIEKNVPAPISRGNGSVSATLRTMEVGDSIVLSGRSNLVGQLARIAWGKGSYVCRKVGDTHTRVWRIK